MVPFLVMNSYDNRYIERFDFSSPKIIAPIFGYDTEPIIKYAPTYKFKTEVFVDLDDIKSLGAVNILIEN